ncbi:hypothetical protein [Donghicola sp. XS_ASV15]|uniref:hypothetical protein n=1 Tax=Donghicola sp. XS_ASV15 TaxID=3241295 RepID=UPI003519C8C0
MYGEQFESRAGTASRVIVARSAYGDGYQDFGRHYGYDRMEMLVFQRKVTRRLYLGMAGLAVGAMALASFLGLIG